MADFEAEDGAEVCLGGVEVFGDEANLAEAEHGETVRGSARPEAGVSSAGSLSPIARLGWARW